MLLGSGVRLRSCVLTRFFLRDQHLPVFDDLVSNKSPQYIAGGATQNTARVAQWQVGLTGMLVRVLLLCPCLCT